MTIEKRIALLTELGQYLLSGDEAWLRAREKAGIENPWFTPAFIQAAIENIAGWLEPGKLGSWASAYQLADEPAPPLNVGVVMAGNIPLVGFHDWLSVFMSGHRARVKLSSKDNILFPHLLQWLAEKEPTAAQSTSIEEILKGADAYIATGSNHSARYFDAYFGKYPHIIRRNRSSAAILSGRETPAELSLLADDIHLYFGMGCRNVTKIYVPEHYDFLPLLESFEPYAYFFDHPKFRNNYDYQLALRILNKDFYMTKQTVILLENNSLFAPVSLLHYEYYKPGQREALENSLKKDEQVQCVAGSAGIPFGSTQKPGLGDFADGVDTMEFLTKHIYLPPVLHA